MALMKYSVGGPITDVKDENSVEKREETSFENFGSQQPSYIIVCGNCKIQHMIWAHQPSQTCLCGNTIKLGDLS